MIIDWAMLLEWVIKAIISSAVLLTGFAYMTLAERKVSAILQQRHGPNRLGPFGFFQPVADGLKLLFKEELIPAGADKFIFIIAPIITVVPALVILAVVPWGPKGAVLACCHFEFAFGGQTLAFGAEYFRRVIDLGIADLNVGMLYILSVASIAVYGVTLAGWSSNNKYAMMGGIRSSAQMVSYELALGLAVIGPLMLSGSMSMSEIIVAQGKTWWFVVLQPIAALIFYLAALAEVNRAPFDMPEAEQELTAGYITEYSGMKFALFMMAEYIKMVGVSAIFVTLFLGGWQGPFVAQIPWLGIGYFWGKVAVSLVFMIWLRSTHPRLRYDRLMTFGWKFLLPLAVVNVLVTGAAMVDVTLMWWVLGVLAAVGAALGLATLVRGRAAGAGRVRA
jgi:NADH-quinone oxidoreductase subunit H